MKRPHCERENGSYSRESGHRGLKPREAVSVNGNLQGRFGLAGPHKLPSTQRVWQKKKRRLYELPNPLKSDPEQGLPKAVRSLPRSTLGRHEWRGVTFDDMIEMPPLT